jgi:hypothetical protein
VLIPSEVFPSLAASLDANAKLETQRQSRESRAPRRPSSDHVRQAHYSSQFRHHELLIPSSSFWGLQRPRARGGRCSWSYYRQLGFRVSSCGWLCLTSRKELMNTATFCAVSSEDAKSATVARQKGLYDAAVAAHPSSILSLQHEVHRESTLSCVPVIPFSYTE